MNTEPYPASELVRRDVVYFYELQSEYFSLEWDLPWDLFGLRYWEFLHQDPEPSDDTVMPRGCLAIIIAGALAHAGNSCEAFGDQLLPCKRRVAEVRYANLDLQRLHALACDALKLATTDTASRDFEGVLRFPDLRWVHDFTVAAYFESRAR